MERNRPIPIGIEFYKEMIDNDYYYVDKTLLIRDLLDQKSKVTLFTRPRRFGKTLAQSTIRTFFEKETAPDGTAIDNSRYFSGKKIMDAGEKYTRHMGQYPVIFISMKSAKQPNFEMAYERLVLDIIHEFEDHKYLLNTNMLTSLQKERYCAIMSHNAPMAEYTLSLKFLSECLENYHHQKVIILIDEYDVPLENAYFHGFYDEMTDFVRSLLESALKTNENLQFAVITGCLRISKESIFTGLNNLKVISVLDESYAEHFGFVQNEVDDLLRAYGIEDRQDEVRQWYDGYLFGNTEVYNPWSLLNYVHDIISHNSEFPKPYWSNTSSNSIVRELIEKADCDTKKELEKLVAGDTIEKQIHEDITYGDIYQSQDNLWNFLFFTGYLKAVGRRFESDVIYLEMKIPNREIRYIYNNTIREWFQKKTKALDFSNLYHAFLSGDTETAEEFLKKQLRESISFMDSAENFYHGFLLGMLTGMQDYEILSNRESGEGRYDILLKPYDEKQPAIILELKRARKFTEMESLCRKALQQIRDRHYDQELIDEGYSIILQYGICFCKKSCKVVFDYHD